MLEILKILMKLGICADNVVYTRNCHKVSGNTYYENNVCILKYFTSNKIIFIPIYTNILKCIIKYVNF